MSPLTHDILLENRRISRNKNNIQVVLDSLPYRYANHKCKQNLNFDSLTVT